MGKWRIKRETKLDSRALTCPETRLGFEIEKKEKFFLVKCLASLGVVWERLIGVNCRYSAYYIITFWHLVQLSMLSC